MDCATRIVTPVQPLAQFLAGLEEGNIFLFHEHGLARARVTPLTGRAVFHGERAKAAQFNAVAAGQRGNYFIKYDVYDALNIALVEMWICRTNTLNYF